MRRGRGRSCDKDKERVESRIVICFDFDIRYLYPAPWPSLPLSCVTESAIIFYYELYLKYFRNKTWQCQRRVNKGRDGGGFTSACSAATWAEISERHMQQESIKCSSSLPQNITKTLSFPDIKIFYKTRREKYFPVSRVSRSTKLQTAT